MGDLARESLALVGYAALLFYYDAKLALVCMTAAPLVVYPLVRLGKRVRTVTRWSQEAQEHMSHVAAEAFAGHRIVKAFGAEVRESEKFEGAARSLYRSNMKVTRVLSMLPPLMELLGGFAIAGALWYGTQEIAGGRLTAGEFTMFVAALLLMYGPVKKLSRVNANLQQAVAASERIFELLDTHSEVRERAGARPLPPFGRDIVFTDVRFGYEDERGGHALGGVSFSVRAGQMVAIVGPSGAGKTTLVNLLPRFYDVTGGHIAIDGHDLRDVTLASLRAQIGMVTQETVLFDDSIAGNIAFGVPRAGAAEIEAAARAAHAHDFIVALPDGYRTTIGERGQRLSGGQRQRLAIARALLKNSPILILDEATSALDAESERLVQDALATLLLNRTSFVIAHRLSTVRRADAIIVLERGHIVEMGRHDELVQRPEGTYARLYQLELVDDRPESRRVADRAGGAPDDTMIKSMTGFASLTREDPAAAVGVTVRAVNHRFLDLQLRLPAAVADLEPRVRGLVQSRLARGRIEVNVSLQLRQAPAPEVELNAPFVQALSAALQTGARAGRDRRRAQARRSAPAAAGAEHPRTAGRRRTHPRGARGARRDRRGRSAGATRRDAHARGGAPAGRPGGPARPARRVRRRGGDGGRSRPWGPRRPSAGARARARGGHVPVDQAALAQEVVRVAQRSDISEEVTRFRGHLAHWEALTDAAEPCGRKLDFLLQEMNREVNTIGSKADGLQVSELVIKAKAELERMREQVQNVE